MLKELTNMEIYDQDVCKDIFDDVNLAINPGQICADIPEGGSGSCNVIISHCL
jgi:ABC-type antimicrobial peptide transport system ATPase subunit